MSTTVPSSPSPVEQFRAKVLNHPHLAGALNDLLVKLFTPHINFTIVTGPSGVGKTTLLKHLRKSLLERFKDEIENDKGSIPFLIMETASPDSVGFNWNDFFHRMLEALKEPQVDWKVPRSELGMPLANHRSTKTSSELRRLAEQSLHHRRTKILIFDEAQHLLRVPNSRRLGDQLEMIKSFASLGDVTVALVGVYGLVEVINMSAQLARRARLIHFPRYRADIMEEARTFANVVNGFEHAFPIRTDGLLREQRTYLYEGSLGCVGVLRDWLVESIDAAVAAGRNHLTRADLERTKLPEACLVQMAEEIRPYEEKLRAQHAHGNKLRELLSLTKPNGAEAEKPKKPHYPGVRKPAHDPVGTNAFT